MPDEIQWEWKYEFKEKRKDINFQLLKKSLGCWF